MSKNSRKKRQSIGQTMGGVVVGFDQQVFRTTPPPHELVLKGTPIRGVSGQTGDELEVLFPNDDPVADRVDGDLRADPMPNDPSEDDRADDPA